MARAIITIDGAPLAPATASGGCPWRLGPTRRVPQRLHCLEREGNALTAADAQGDHTAADAVTPHGVQ